jgi:hypothetical protein
VKVQSIRVETREDQQLLGCGLAHMDILVSQKGSTREDLQLSGWGQVNTKADTVNQGDFNPPGQSMSSTCGPPCPVNRAEGDDGEVDSYTGRKEDQL